MTRLSILILAWLTASLLMPRAATADDGEPFNLRIIQRGADGEPVTLDYQGTDYPNQALGFASNGVFGPLTLLQTLPSGTALQVLRRNAVNTGLEFADPAAGVTAGDKGDLTVSGLGVWTIDDNTITGQKVVDGTLTNPDIAANAGIDLTKLSQRVGTTWAGTTEAPITTTPYSPTWTTETLAVVYGVNGTFNLPPLATYNGAAVVVITQGAFNVTMNPNGSEIIWKNGAALAPGADDTITGSAGLMTTYAARGSRWVRVAGGGGGGTGDAQLTGGNSFTGNQSVDGNISATGNVTVTGNITAIGTITGSHAGSAAAMTEVPGSQIVGPLSNDLNKGRYFSDLAPTWQKTDIAATTGSTITIDTTKGHTVIHLNEATETIALSGAPEDGTPILVYVDAHSADCEVTTPSMYSEALGGNRLGFTVRAGKDAVWRIWRIEGAWWQWEPFEIDDLDEATVLALTDQVEVSVAGVSKRASLATVKKALRVGTKLMGTIATGFTTSPTTLDWENNDTILCMVGGNGTHNLPAASTLGGVAGIFYSFNTSATITLNPNDADYIRRGATTQADGISITITGTPGQTFFVITDGTNWATAGGTATAAEGS